VSGEFASFFNYLLKYEPVARGRLFMGNSRVQRSCETIYFKEGVLKEKDKDGILKENANP
jgi:hypothetical protein